MQDIIEDTLPCRSIEPTIQQEAQAEASDGDDGIQDLLPSRQALREHYPGDEKREDVLHHQREREEQYEEDVTLLFVVAFQGIRRTKHQKDSEIIELIVISGDDDGNRAQEEQRGRKTPEMLP
jgi:hypothetical protein